MTFESPEDFLAKYRDFQRFLYRTQRLTLAIRLMSCPFQISQPVTTFWACSTPHISRVFLPQRIVAEGQWLLRQFNRAISGAFPIPDAPAAEREAIGGLATQITAQAQARYALHRQARHRILTDLAAAGKDGVGRGGVTPPLPGTRLNQKLTAWWELDFSAFRGEIQKVFRQDIPLKERDAWEAWLAEHCGQHDQLTAEIVRLETDLNRRVYALFDLSAAEIKLIEASTKYRYGEV